MLNRQLRKILTNKIYPHLKYWGQTNFFSSSSSSSPRLLLDDLKIILPFKFGYGRNYIDKMN